MAGSVFTTRFRQRNRIIGGLVLLAAGTSPFLVGLVLITSSLPSGAAPAIITLLCFVLAGLLPWLALDRLSLLGNDYLRQQLATKLPSGAEDTEELPQPEFVGFSPGEELRNWDGDTDSDVGFLTIGTDALVYRGDEYSWVLRRETIDTVQVVAVSGGLGRILIKWHAPREPGRALTLASREGRSLRKANRITAGLLRSLQRWKEAAGADADEPPPLGLPPTDISGSHLVDRPPTGSCATILAVTTIVTLSIWLAAQQFVSAGFYLHGILWAGLIAMGGAMFTVHFLSYLQSYEARLASK